MTLESQYKQYLKVNPESKKTYEEWLKMFSENLLESLKKSNVKF